MQRRQPMRAQVGALLQSAAEKAGDLGIQAIRRTVARVDALSNRLNAGSMGSRVVDAISDRTEQAIAKSPVPIPAPVREALGRMHEALGQLSQSIDTINAGASSLTRDDSANNEAARRKAMDDARVAFTQSEFGQDDEGQTGHKKSRRSRGRRNTRGAEDTQSTQATTARADKLPNNPS